MGRGGVGNLEQHKTGEAHRRAMEVKHYPSIMSFFNKQPKAVKSSVPVPPHLTGATQTFSASPTEQPQSGPSQILENRILNSKFIMVLRALTAQLPPNVPVAIATDPIASFAMKPTIDPTDEDQWEIFDGILKRLLGWGKSQEEISQIIRRGP